MISRTLIINVSDNVSEIRMALECYEGVNLSTTYGNIIVLDEKCYESEEFIVDPLDVLELIQYDYGVEITIIVGFDLHDCKINQESLFEYIETLNSGIYYIEDFILHTVLDNNLMLIDYFRNTLLEVCGKDVCDTVLGFIAGNLNTVATAKKMYLHRNTLNYRLDKFLNLTGLNVKTFRGANAIFMLFYNQ